MLDACHTIWSKTVNSFICILFPARATSSDRKGHILVLALILFIGEIAAAQTKTCECEFSSKDYQAYGTDGACGVFMYNQSRTCEISFAGTGANKEVLTSILGENAWETTLKFAPLLFNQYLVYAQEGDKGLYLNNTFLGESIVVLVRGAIFRESSLEADLPLKEIDTAFMEFSAENQNQIAETFQGKDKPFKVEWDKGVSFSVGEGYVEMNFQDRATIRAVYFSTRRQ